VARNLELKVRCPESLLNEVRRRAAAGGAGPFVRLRQEDTYFPTRSGRLKLRVITSDDGSQLAELISYHREDAKEARWSDYLRIEVAPGDVRNLLLALSSTLGIAGVVEKEREVAILRSTRIHFDRVAGLGAFVELETVAIDTDDRSAANELAAIAVQLGIEQLTPIGGSYVDL
jgi:adenylate cyclase class IV